MLSGKKKNRIKVFSDWSEYAVYEFEIGKNLFDLKSF
jgi:hypothetical protein